MVVSSCGLQPEGKTEIHMGQFEAQVLATEDAYVAAEIDGDEEALNSLVDEHFVYNSADGTTTGKKEFINSVISMNMLDQTISERSVIIEGDMGIICGTAELKLQSPGEEPSLTELRYTSVYVRREKQWRMLALQMQSRTSR